MRRRRGSVGLWLAAAARASLAAIAANLAGGACRRERARRTKPWNRVGQQSSTWAAVRLKRGPLRFGDSTAWMVCPDHPEVRVVDCGHRRARAQQPPEAAPHISGLRHNFLGLPRRQLARSPLGLQQPGLCPGPAVRFDMRRGCASGLSAAAPSDEPKRVGKRPGSAQGAAHADRATAPVSLQAAPAPRRAADPDVRLASS